jgi:hypothetical protein
MFLLVHINPNAIFSQDSTRFKISSTGRLLIFNNSPDTTRATLFVYYGGNTSSILHTKPGFVVRQVGKEEIYLDDRKTIIKTPLEVFSYKIKKQ